MTQKECYQIAVECMERRKVELEATLTLLEEEVTKTDPCQARSYKSEVEKLNHSITFLNDMIEEEEKAGF